jgi:hypothetical protein
MDNLLLTVPNTVATPRRLILSRTLNTFWPDPSNHWKVDVATAPSSASTGAKASAREQLHHQENELTNQLALD